MANSSVRCNVCRNYFKTEDMFRTGLGGFGGVCSEECFEAYLEKYRTKRVRRKAHREMKYDQQPGRIPGSVRDHVRRRDNEKCQWCGTDAELQIHHVRYRSEGGPDNKRNLILLCAEHHTMAHSNKKKYQPILLLWLYFYYEILDTLQNTEHGVKIMDVVPTVPATFRIAKLHPEWLDDARAFSDMVMAEKAETEIREI